MRASTGRTRSVLYAAVGIGGIALVAIAGLARATPPASGIALPPEKQAIVDTYVARQQAGQAHPAPKLGPAAVPSAAPDLITPTVARTPMGAGYLVDAADTMRPAGDSTDAFTNSWYALGPALNVDVWAGTHALDPNQAFLLVVRWDAHRLSILSSGTYDAPTKVGPITIVAATGTTLTLRAADGTSYTFDVLTHRFG